MRHNDELCIKNEELCIENEELWIIYDESWIKTMNFAAAVKAAAMMDAMMGGDEEEVRTQEIYQSPACIYS